MTSSGKLLLRLGLLAIALGLESCSTTPAPSTPSTTTTTPTTPASAPVCTYAVSPTSISASAAGGSSTVTVTTQTGCAWTAAASASFITITSGASGTGNGSVVLNIAQDGGSNRTGTVTVAGQTVTVTQAGANIIVAFEMTDPPSQAGPTSICRIKGSPGYPISTCPLGNTSRTTGVNFLVNWAWTVKYTYDGQDKTQTQSSGTLRDFMVQEYCGRNPSSATGVAIPITVSLTVTDNNGIQATATSGSGNQPAMTMVTYTCGS